MIGNDVVDLALAKVESDWRRKGFLEKLFSDNEIQLIVTSENPELSVWNLWSRKEAAYKIFNRKTGNRRFNPKYFECMDLSPESKVTFGNESVFSKTEVDLDLIYTICVSHKTDFSFVVDVPNSEILKKDGIPYVRSGELTIPATVSHHGRFERCVALLGDRFNLNFSG